MPFAGTFPSSALLLLLVLWAEAAQPVEGLMSNNGYYDVLPGDATATGAAQMCMCYQGSAFDGEARLMLPGTCCCRAGAVAVLLPGPAMLLNGAGAAPWRAPSSTPECQRAPPAILPGAAPAHEKCSSWPPAKAKPWFLLFLAVTIQIIVLLSW